MTRTSSTRVCLDGRLVTPTAFMRALESTRLPQESLDYFMANATFVKTSDWHMDRYRSGPRKNTPCLRHNVDRSRTMDIPEDWSSLAAPQGDEPVLWKKSGFNSHESLDGRFSTYKFTSRFVSGGSLTRGWILADRSRRDPDRPHQYVQTAYPTLVEAQAAAQAIMDGRPPQEKAAAKTDLTDTTQRLILADMYEDAGDTRTANILRTAPEVLRLLNGRIVEAPQRLDLTLPGNPASWRLGGEVAAAAAVFRLATRSTDVFGIPNILTAGSDVTVTAHDGHFSQETPEHLLDRLAEAGLDMARGRYVMTSQDLSDHDLARLMMHTGATLCDAVGDPSRAEACRRIGSRIE